MREKTEEPVRLHRGAAEAVVKLSSNAAIEADTEAEFPILAITDGPLSFLLMPYGPSEGGPIAECDVRRASDLVMAACDYRNALSVAYAKQEGRTPSVRRSVRR